MFGKHVKRDLSAYAHGELRAAEAERVAAHLRGCGACRAEFEEVKLGIRLVESLPQTKAPDALWEAVEARLTAEAAKDAGRGARSAGRLWRGGLARPVLSWRSAAAFASVLLVAFGGWFYYRSTRPAWEVARIGAAGVGERGSLRVGDWLETSTDERARVEVANIGEVEVGPNTRLRLVETRLTEHRLELRRGTLSARIYAPPRLFFVDTPSAVAADLGCAYTLEVDDAGRGLLHVTSGWVALEAAGRESVVPAGAACLTKPGAGPGTPFFVDAPDELLSALSRLDFEAGGPAALDAALDAARPRDTLTLWHLLSRVDEGGRARVYERLAAISPPPAGVTREQVMRLERDALGVWKDDLEGGWTSESLPGLRRTLRKVLQ